MKVKPDGSFGWANVNAVSFLGIDLTAFFQLSDGGYLAAGTRWSASGNDDLWISRMDSVGRMFWLRRLDDGAADGVPDLVLTGQGGAMFVASSEVGDEGDSSLWLARFPVQTGEVPVGLPGTTIEDGDYSLNEGMCVELLPSAIQLDSSFAVSWVEESILEENAPLTVEP